MGKFADYWRAAKEAIQDRVYDAVPRLEEHDIRKIAAAQSAAKEAPGVGLIQEAHDRLLYAERTGTAESKRLAGEAQMAVIDNPAAAAMLGNLPMAADKSGIIVDFDGGINRPVYVKSADLAGILASHTTGQRDTAAAVAKAMPTSNEALREVARRIAHQAQPVQAERQGARAAERQVEAIKP
jgi:hypothetical protein